MSPLVTLILDLVIAGLLVATIVFAIQLNRQLVRLREGRSEMEGLIRSFNDATARAEAGIKTMRRAATETGEGLQKSIERAQSLRDELQFLVEAADSLARRLAETPTQARAAAAPPPPRRPAPADEGVDPRGRAQELLRVLAREGGRGGPSPEPGRGGPTETTRGAPAPETPRSRVNLTRGEPAARSGRLAELLDTSQDLPRGRGILTRDDAFTPPPPRPEPSRGERRGPEPARRDSGEGLSRAERELLHAIESRR